MPRLVTRRRGTTALAVGALVIGLTSSLTTSNAFGAEGLPLVADYEGTPPITTTGPGIFPFGPDAASAPKLSQQKADRPGAGSDNHVLDVDYDITVYGGFSHNFPATQNWSEYGGFSFWYKGTGEGQKIQFEVKDGGPDGEKAELFESFLTDDSTDWKQIKAPFSSFVKRTSYQPAGAPTDGSLDLTEMWGYALNLVPGKGKVQLDQVELYGTASARVGFTTDAYLVDAGGSVDVKVAASQPGGKPLADDVTVAYTVGGGTAEAGKDYTATDGTLTFAAGTPSGTEKTITITTIGGTPPSIGKTIPVKLTSENADVTSAEATVVINAHGLPYQDSKLPVATRVADLMSRMTLEDKVGQMTQAERLAVGNGSEIVKYRLGSLLSGGGSVPTPNTPEAWADMVDNFQKHALATPLQIPLIYGIDSVHGNNNLQGATIFPHNLGMGASRNPALNYENGRITAKETRATGIPWAFSPCLCVTREDRWGRTYESFGEDPALVKQLSTIIDGLQGDDLKKNTGVLATAKHFLGDGGTAFGTSTTGTYTTDQGVTTGTQEEIDAIHLSPFVTAIEKDVRTVMPSYSSLQILGKDEAPIKMHARADQITGVLKRKLGFKGFVISDWAAIDQINPDYKIAVRDGVNAGTDMIMVPNKIKDFTTFLTEHANSGAVSAERIDDAVKRILIQKFDLGLFEKPYADRTHLKSIGGAEHRAIARQAAAESQVLLKNQKNVLPLAKNAKVYVAGGHADDLGLQSGGWTLTWQGEAGNKNVGTTILGGIKQVAPGAKVTHSKDASAPVAGHDVGLVVVGEKPYAEGAGDVGNGNTLQLTSADRKAVDKVCAAMKCVVVLVSGRPLDITGFAPRAAAIVASWLPGTEGAGVADVLFGAKPFVGRLPLTWYKSESQLPINVGDKNYDPLYPFGWGLRTDAGKARLQAVRDDLAKIQGDANVSAAVLAIDTALKPAAWKEDGSVRNPSAVLPALLEAATALKKSTKDSYRQNDLVVSVARDIVQGLVSRSNSLAMTKTSKLTSNADHELLVDNPQKAMNLLIQAHEKVKIN